MISQLVYRMVFMVFGVLLPVYESYKAVKTKDVRQYLRWMMYWIVFGLFMCAEIFTDILLGFWFPFYYEIKVVGVFWLLSPTTKGSSFIYRKFVHPAFEKREPEIDEMILQTKERGYNTIMRLGSQSVAYATQVILQTAVKGGGGLMEQIIKKSYSLTDLPRSPQQANDVVDVATRPTRPGATRGRRSAVRSAADLRFSEVDVDIRTPNRNSIIGDIRSSEDISSGYSSTDQLYTEGVLTRSSSVTSARVRGTGSRASVPRRAPLTEDYEEDSEDEFESAMPIPVQSHPNLLLSSFHSVQVSTQAQGVLSDNKKLYPDDYSSRGSSQYLLNTQLPDYAANLNLPSFASEANESSRNLLDPSDIRKTGSQCSLLSNNSDGSAGDPDRKGKYNKKLAPPPPAAVAGPPPRLAFPERFTDD